MLSRPNFASATNRASVPDNTAFSSGMTNCPNCCIKNNGYREMNYGVLKRNCSFPKTDYTQVQVAEKERG